LSKPGIEIKSEEKLKKAILSILIFLGLGLLFSSQVLYGEVYTVAVLGLEAKGKASSELKDKIIDLVTVNLSANPQFTLVERERLEQIFEELGLGLSGLIDETEACKVGQLVGAKILVTGRIFIEDGELVVVAKIIGTETSKVYGETVRVPFSQQITPQIDKLARKICAIVTDKGTSIVAGSSKDRKKTVALMNLRSVTGDKNLITWSENLTSKLTVKLSKREEFTLIERVQLNKVLEEINLSKSGYVSPQDAIKVGKILGAQIMVLPLCIPLGKEKLRIDVHFVNPQTSRIRGAITMEGLRKNPAALEKELMEKIETKLIYLTTAE